MNAYREAQQEIDDLIEVFTQHHGEPTALVVESCSRIVLSATLGMIGHPLRSELLHSLSQGIVLVMASHCDAAHPDKPEVLAACVKLFENLCSTFSTACKLRRNA